MPSVRRLAITQSVGKGSWKEQSSVGRKDARVALLLEVPRHCSIHVVQIQTQTGDDTSGTYAPVMALM